MGGALYEWVINIPVPYLDKLVPVCHQWSARLQPMPPCLSLLVLCHRHRHSVCCTALDCLAKMKPSDAISTFGSTLKELAHPSTPSAWCWRSPLSRTIPDVINTGTGTGAHRSCIHLLLAFLGWLGVFLTGSDTSSNALSPRCKPPQHNKLASLICCWLRQYHRWRHR